MSAKERRTSNPFGRNTVGSQPVEPWAFLAWPATLDGMRLSETAAAVLRPAPVVLLAAYLAMAHLVTTTVSTNYDAFGRPVVPTWQFTPETRTWLYFSTNPADNWTDAGIACGLLGAFVWLGRKSKPVQQK